jgi:DNA topoisomerase-2
VHRQFGSRHNGGRDFASPRYIFTHLSPLMRLLFPIEDDAQLKYEQEDGLLVEPTHYIPIIPMLLINGAEGIGTGWSTSIPPHDIQDVINYTKYLVSGTVPTNLLTPSVNGLKGMITKDKNNYVSHGVITRTSKTMVKITELPYGNQCHYQCKLFNI